MKILKEILMKNINIVEEYKEKNVQIRTEGNWGVLAVKDFEGERENVKG